MFDIYNILYIILIILLYCIRPSIVLFSYSAFGCNSVLLNQLPVMSLSCTVFEI